jgi:hypothetical protein
VGPERTQEESAREKGEQLRQDMAEWRKRMLFDDVVKEAQEREREQEREK